MKKIIILLFIPFSAFSWEGYNSDTGSYFEVESYDHRGMGEGEVEFYDQKTREYRQGYLDMYPGGSGNLYDYESGENYSVDMD